MREFVQHEEGRLEALPKECEGDVVKGVALVESVGHVTFEEVAEDLGNDYQMNGRCSRHSAQNWRRRADVLSRQPRVVASSAPWTA